MARAKKEEGEKRPTAYSKKFKEKVVKPEEAKEIMEKPIVKTIEKSKEDLKKAFKDDDVKNVIPSAAVKYDAEVVGQLIAAANKSRQEHGIVNVIELSRTYYIPIEDVRGILEEIGLM